MCGANCSKNGTARIAIPDIYSLKALPAAIDEAERVTEASMAIRVMPVSRYKGAGDYA